MIREWRIAGAAAMLLFAAGALLPAGQFTPTPRPQPARGIEPPQLDLPDIREPRLPPAQRINVPRTSQPQSAETTGVSVPDELARCAKVLFAQGMADPGSYEYRQLEIRARHGNGTDAVPVHGWLLPPRFGRREAVCWNGLIYPVATIGEPADLEQDIATMLTAPANAPWRTVTSPEAQIALLTQPHPLHVCILSHIGQPVLASRVWAACVEREKVITADRTGNAVALASYPVLGWAWARSLWTHAVYAHVRGDDEVARDTARLLEQALPAIAAEMSRTNGPYRDYRLPGGTQPGRELNFAQRVRLLREDLDRRYREAPREAWDKQRAGTDFTKLATRIPDRRERILLLVRGLENDTVTGNLAAPEGDSAQAALELEGIDALMPLIGVLQQDIRLTRVLTDLHGAGYPRPRTQQALALDALVGLGALAPNELIGLDTEDPLALATVVEKIKLRYDEEGENTLRASLSRAR